jgi:predicted metalloprotease with PDZ domain
VTAAASLAAAYAVLYATARLLFERDVCDVADRHGSDWVAELRTASGLLPVATILELVADGEECRCICPACGIGACLCMRNSIETVREQWGQPGLERADGIELRIPPRAGSQLAEAGLQAGDRILAIDGEVVHDNRELQQALRRSDIGEPRRARVIQNADEREIPVARVRDLP